MFLLFSFARLSEFLKNTSQDVSELLSKSLNGTISSTSGLKKSGNAFFGTGKYLKEIDFTINGFSQKMYLMAVNNVGNEVKLQCSCYFTTGSVDEEKSKAIKSILHFPVPQQLLIYDFS